MSDPDLWRGVSAVQRRTIWTIFGITAFAIAGYWRMGIAPEEIPLHLPHLTLAQVFDALSYFSDHQEEILQHIERNRIPE